MSGISTFLFTDIEGSTRRWEADADAMRAALEAHNATLREAIESHGGQVFNYTGDGMCAVFASPRGAVDAAITAQVALELPVRMGIGTGEAELRGGEYFGTVLNRAARVMAAGHGGQILLDGATAALISDIDLISLGPRHLRDIAKAVDIFQAQAVGLRTKFPPLKTVDPTPGNLRVPTSSFIGREAELAELETALKAHRMLTLTGVGGVGKTRLALEVAARSANDFPDGVWVIELASVGDPAAVPEAVAAVLGIVQQPGSSLADSVAAALEGRCRLLVFDNCEHVLDAAADMIDAIFTHSQTVKVLATSREGLRVADEHLWSVPSLDLTAGIDSSAAALFVERAEAVVQDLALNETNDAEAVVEICRQLDGIPLGIELAASRMQSMTATEVRDRLGDRFRLLVGSRRGLERHQTLRHAVQWSYDLLDDAERSLLDRCSVFAGGFDLAGAQAVTESDDDFAVLEQLDALVRKSLVVADRSSVRTRFSMLETIRQFTEERLVQSGAADDVRTAHARYFADRESDVFAVWDSPRQHEAYSWLTAELANLRAAFRWAADHGDLDTAATIVHFATFVGNLGDQHEPIRWAEELIEPARAVQHRRLAQLYAMATLCFTFGRIDDALGYATEGEAAIMSGRFDEVREEYQSTIGSAYGAAGQLERRIEWSRAVVARHPDTHIHSQACLALALKTAGADDEAIAASNELLTAADTTNDPNLIVWALSAYGAAHRDAAPAAAYDALRRGLSIARDNGGRYGEANIAVMLSMLATDHGDPDDAFEYVILSIRFLHDSGRFFYLPVPLAVLVVLLDRLEDYESAATISGFAATSYARSTVPRIGTAVRHLREVLGDEAFDALSRKGERTTAPGMVAYAFEQIGRVRAQLSTAGETQ